MDKKKGKLKRGMGILLAVVMLFNTLPISGFFVSASEKQETLDAANAPTPIEEPSEDAVAMVKKEGEAPSYVTSLADAFVTGNSGAKITLLADVDIGKTGLTVPENTNFTLDCGSFTLSGDGNYTIEVKPGGTLAFAGGTVCNAGYGAAAAVSVSGTFTMSGGVLDSTSSYALLVNARYAQVTVIGGTVGINGIGLCVIDNIKATIALSGGTYSSISPGREGTNGNYTYHPVSSVLAPGCALKGADGFIRGEATGSQKKVTVVACTHDGGATPNEDGATHGGICPYCGTVIENAPHTLGADNKCEGCNTSLVASVKIGNATTYYGDIDGAWTAAGRAESAVVTLLANVTTSSLLEVSSGSNITLNGGEHILTSTIHNYSILVSGGRLTITGGTFIGDSTVLVVLSGTVNLSGGEFRCDDDLVYTISCATDVTLASLLSNYGSTNAAEKHYAYYRDGGPISLVDDSGTLTGTVTVGECEHKGVTPTPNNDGTHSLKCPYCGYTGPAEDCSYGTEYQHDDTDHWLTCTVCGYENKEAHNWEFDSAQSGNVIENHRECFACRRTKNHLTLTITVPDGLTYGNTEGKQVTCTVSPKTTCDKINWKFTGGSWLEFADGVLPANLPVGEHWFRVEGLMSDDTIVFSGSYYFTVAPAPLTVDMVTLFPESVTYSGTEQKPAVTVKQGDTPLAEGTDYDVTYSTTDFTNAGTITVTITGKGNYKGTVKKTYSIAKVPLTIKASNQEITYGDNIETNLGGQP